MSDNSANNKRIAKNTIFLYFRMLIKMLVSLYTSRIVLEYLGITDYGIYNVVGGIVTLFGFIVGPMTISVQRFLSYELGKKTKSQETINTIFSMAIFIHIILSIIICIIAETIGLSIFHTLQIPSERIDAAKWVLQISIISSCFTVLQIPYTGLIVAYEKMDAYAYISIIEVFLKLLIVFLLPIIPHDALITYAILVLITTVIVQFLYIIYCKTKIKDVQIKRKWDKKMFKDLSSFASWSMLGEIAWSATNQGVNIILGNFFSPVVNAARGITVQILTALNQFVYNFQTAMNPQIIKYYAAKDISSMNNLTLQGIKFSYFLMFAISLPFLFNIELILSIWLKTVPEYTAIFCRLAIIGVLCDTLSNLFATVVKASGKIKYYQITLSLCLFLNLPLSYIFLYLNFSPSVVYIIYIGVSITIIFIRLFFIQRICGLKILTYITNVSIPVIITTFFALIIPTILYYINITNTLLGTLSNFLICFISPCLSILFVGLTKNERNTILLKAHLIKR